MSWRSPKLLRKAEGQACTLCGARGTTVCAHANSVALGKGTGIKAPDYYTAWVCVRCHNQIDGRTGALTKDERQNLWQLGFVRTIGQLFEQDIIVVK